MEKWLGTCILLCTIGLLKELRPSEPFITEYLTGPWKNLTIDQVVQDVYPVWTYSYLAILLVIFIVTHFLLYKPVVVLESVCYILTSSVLIWGQGVPAMQVVEFLFAAATASRVAYNTYIYTKVPTDRFQIVTAYTKAALLAGRCLAGIIGQVLITTGTCDYFELNYLSLGFVTLAAFISCFLPRVDHSIYFRDNEQQNNPINDGASKDQKSHALKDEENVQNNMGSDTNLPTKDVVKETFRLLWQDFTTAFSDRYTLKWSFWWAVAMCGYFQVGNYIQPLWETISPSTSLDEYGHQTDIYNGGIVALQTFLSALATLAIGHVQIDWSVYGEYFIAAISILEGVLLIFASIAKELWVAYITFVIFSVSYSVLITIASSEVAKGLKKESYSLVFGINTFVALVFETILTLIVADDVGLSLDPRQQFKVYGGYYIVLGIFFLVMCLYNVFVKNGKK